MEMKIELVPVPVSDVDMAKAFYVDKVGFHDDTDQKLGEMRFVQLTPPGSACSIVIGEGITKQDPGTVDGIVVVVKDAKAVYEKLRERGVEIAEPKMMPWGAIHADFSDPDGNRWTLQQLASRSASSKE